MADSKSGARSGGRGSYVLELVGLDKGASRPPVLVQTIDAKGGVQHTAKVGDDGAFALPPEALKNARYVVFGAPADDNGIAADSAVRFRQSEFESAARSGTVALAEGIWSRFRFHWQCVSGSVRVCRRRPWWFDTLIAASAAVSARSAVFQSPQTFAAARLGSSAIDRLQPSVGDLFAWPARCSPVCLGTVEVYRRSCCCWPIVFDDTRIPDLIRDLEILVDQLPTPRPPRHGFPPPPPPPVDPFATPIFKGGALNELALNAPADLRALRSLTSDQAAQYVNSRIYLLRRLCTCGRAAKVAGGPILADGTFNICWLESIRLTPVNCHDEYAYVVKQTIGGTTTTIYDGVTAGIWFQAGDSAVLTSYLSKAFSCHDTGTGDGTAFVYLDLIGDTESHELTTPVSTAWDSVAAPTADSGLLFPNPADSRGHLRNLGGGLELTFNFSEGLKHPSVGAFYYRVSVTKADAAGHPTGDRHYYGEGLHPGGDGLTWQKAVITGTGVDIVPDTLGPVQVGDVKFLYRIPYDSDAEWTGSVRHHALVHTLNAALNVPADVETAFGSPASNHLVTLELFNAAGERLRPLGVPASGQDGVEVAKAFKFRRWFQPEGSPGDDTMEVPFAALTHLFCWDNRAPRADITRLVMDGAGSDEDCQFLVGPSGSTFGIEYRAYVPDERFQRSHGISWIRGLNGNVANGGAGSLPAPLSPGNVGEPPAVPQNSGTNTFQTMLTSIDAVPPIEHLPIVLTRCAFAVTLTTHAKTTDGGNLHYPYAQETAAFALEIG